MTQDGKWSGGADRESAADAGTAPIGELPVGSATLWWGRLTLIVYHLLFIVVALVALPILVWRFATDRRYRTGLLERSGRVARTRPGQRCVWIHGVSVGEVRGCADLIARISAAHPEFEIVVSATTSTGYAMARMVYPGARVIYYPIDFGLFPRRALDRIRPDCVLLMELEIWPNFLQAAACRGVPVAVINGRISERSFRGYRYVRWLLPQLRYLGLYCVQIPAYRDRLLRLDVPGSRIVVTGNMKYDGAKLGELPARSAELREWLVPDGWALLVCGSTHGREDEWVARAAREIAAAGRPLRLVTVPRHPERSPVVDDALTSQGFRPVRWTQCSVALPELGPNDAVVVDAIGQLEAFYGACDVAFVGGSLVPHGGQNMIEPAALGRAVVFGPHTENFRVDVEMLLSAQAAVRISRPEELAETLERLLGDEVERAGLASRARDVIRSNQGATERTAGILAPLFRD